MLKVGFVGWRGLVGSVLLERMEAEGDFRGFESGFFSTSNPGGKAPEIAGTRTTDSLIDAHDIDALSKYDVIVSCQGGDYTRAVHPELRTGGWSGYWIDAASALRMEPTSALILDPVNEPVIQDALAADIRDYCGANCTVSLMLMGLVGLFRADAVEWMTSMTYQAASGAGAATMTELTQQFRHVSAVLDDTVSNPAATALEIERTVSDALRSEDFPIADIGVPLAGSLIPWIDKIMPGGQSREEWKAKAEGNKILGREHDPVPMDGLCVRIAAMRCHAQAFTIKLKRKLALDEIEHLIGSAHPWVELIDNEPEASAAKLTPAHVTGSLIVPVGRVRTMDMGEDYISAFSVGDQLLWGAAEPLRRMLNILRGHLRIGGAQRDGERAVA